MKEKNWIAILDLLEEQREIIDRQSEAIKALITENAHLECLLKETKKPY